MVTLWNMNCGGFLASPKGAIFGPFAAKGGDSAGSSLIRVSYPLTQLLSKISSVLLLLMVYTKFSLGR